MVGGEGRLGSNREEFWLLDWVGENCRVIHTSARCVSDDCQGPGVQCVPQEITEEPWRKVRLTRRK